MAQQDKSIGVWCCPVCNGTGNIKRPHGMRKDMGLKRDHANRLRDQGYSIREIATIMGYKSPRSVQDLLKPSTCLHPNDKRVDWHDSSILCSECNCIIEQFGKRIEPPHKLS